MMSLYLHDEVVEIQKIAMVASKKRSIFAGGMGKVHSVVCTAQTNVDGQLGIVPCLK